MALTLPDDVVKIKERLNAGEKQAVVAADFSISRSAISDIATGRLHPEIGPPVKGRVSRRKSVPEFDPTNSRIRDLEAEIEHLVAERDFARKAAKAATKDDGLFKAIVKELQGHLRPIRCPNIPKIRPRKSQIVEDLVIHLSDGHHDEIVDPEEVGGLEAYNFDISTRRAETYIDTVLGWAHGTLASSFHFRRVWVLAYGDHTSGEIHGHTPRSAFRNQFKNCLAIGDLHALMLRDLAGSFNEVIAVYVPGNHGRTTPKKDHHGAHSNWDYLIAEVARRRLVDVPNVQLIVPNSFSINLDIAGIGFNVSHGDDVSGSLGLPWYGLARRQKGLQAINQIQGGTRIRYFCCGHFHKPGSIGDLDGELMVNGPWVATNAYAYNRFSGFTEPSQWIHGVREDKGITWRMDVKLRSEGEEEGPRRYQIAV